MSPDAAQPGEGRAHQSRTIRPGAEVASPAFDEVGMYGNVAVLDEDTRLALPDLFAAVNITGRVGEASEQLDSTVGAELVTLGEPVAEAMGEAAVAVGSTVEKASEAVRAVTTNDTEGADDTVEETVDGVIGAGSCWQLKSVRRFHHIPVTPRPVRR